MNTPKCRNGWCRLPLHLINGQLVCLQCLTDEARLRELPPLERYRNAKFRRQS